MKEHLVNRISKMHKRALSLVYDDFSSVFSELLEKDKSVTIHHVNLETMAYEIFKIKNNMAPQILREIFLLKKSNYNLGNSTTLQDRGIKTVTYGLGTILNRIRKILCPLRYSKRKFVNGPQRMVYVVRVPTKHCISLSYLHARRRFVTRDIQLNDIQMIYK